MSMQVGYRQRDHSSGCCLLNSVLLSHSFYSLARIEVYRINIKLLFICEVNLKYFLQAHVREKDLVSVSTI